MVRPLSLRQPRGLRWKFFLKVVLPPLVPFMIIGYLGYHQLSGLISNVVYGQLDRSATATATRVNREFSIRETVLEQTGKDVLAIRQEYDGQQTTLNQQSRGCISASLVSSQNAIKSPDCKPFLAEFATLNVSVSGSSTDHTYFNSYLQAINGGLASQLALSKQNEAAKIKEQLTNFEHYFPETGPIAVIANTEEIVGQLTSNKFSFSHTSGPWLSHKSLDSQTSKDGQLYLVASYPLDNKGDAILAAYNVSSPQFLANIKDSGPHIDKNDQIWLADQSGNLVFPDIKLGDRNELSGDFHSLSSDKTSNSTVTYHRPDNDHIIMVAKAAKVPDMGWIVLTASPVTAISSKIQSTQNIALLAIIGSLIVSALVGLLFVSSATSAIKRLTDGALVFAKRNFNHKINVKTGDELETLANTLNDMAGQIESAEKALDEKNKEFINIATHELKAPMTAIIGYLSMIIDDNEGKVDTVARDFITQAYRSTERLRDLVTEMLDIARLESGKAQFDIKPLDIVQEASMAVNNLKITAKDKEISLIYQPPANLPKVAADQTKLGIIVTNFISNAIKYNRPKGSVTVSHRLDGNFIETSIADTGLGIPKDQQSQMFQKFFRVSSDNRAGIPGTGLGLHITKQFIETMGGKVWFESEEGKGTTFFFTLPVAAK